MMTPPADRSEAAPSDIGFAAHVDAAAALLRIPLAAKHRTEAAAALAMIMAQADLVLDFALPDAAEAAPRFRP